MPLSLEIKNGILLHESTNYIQQNMHDTPANNRLPAQPKTAKVIH